MALRIIELTAPLKWPVTTPLVNHRSDHRFGTGGDEQLLGLLPINEAIGGRSDGLLRHAKQQDIARIARGPDLATAARTLIELVRIPSGALEDDVATTSG